MIDVHCHILPGIDDGAVDMADSVAMARVAAADGIRAICATPHIRHDHDVRIGELAGRVAELNRTLDQESVPVAILPGGELAEASAAGLTDAELDAVTLGGGGRWLLVEPAPGPLSGSLEEVVGALARRGYASVVAHPERHFGDDPAGALRRLVERGALIQATADSLLRAGSAGPLLELAAAGLVHVTGSDSHSSRYGRPVQVARAAARLRAAEGLEGGDPHPGDELLHHLAGA
jgi:protein-tyrosine phosphatase